MIPSLTAMKRINLECLRLSKERVGSEAVRRFPQGFWKNTENHRRFFLRLAEHLNIKRFEDWYRVTVEDVIKFGGETMITAFYGRCIVKALVTLFPEHGWLEWKFRRVPEGFWLENLNRRRYFEWLAEQWNFQSHEDWYRVRLKHIWRQRGLTIMHVAFRQSVSAAVQSVFPEYAWKPWLFVRASGSFWNQPNSADCYLEWAAERLQVRDPRDWCRVSYRDFLVLGGSGLLLRSSGSLSIIESQQEYLGEDEEDAEETLKKKQRNDDPSYFPQLSSIENNRDIYRKSNQKKLITSKKSSRSFYKGGKTQMLMLLLINQLFPYQYDILQNFRHPRIREFILLRQQQQQSVSFDEHSVTADCLGNISKRAMELDVYIPSLDIALEYHGQQHYLKHFLFGEPEIQKQKDLIKEHLCEKLGITLVIIPYWWDHQISSIQANIHERRPDLLPKNDRTPIASFPPVPGKKYSRFQ